MKSSLNINILILAVLFFLLGSCEKKPEQLSLEKVKYNTNKSGYPTAKMDSAQAVTSITRQKTREVLELSILYHNGNKDSEIDNALYEQIRGYFLKPDSLTLKPLMQELDSLQVSNAKINQFNVEQRVKQGDTLNFALFDVEYFDKSNRSLGSYRREAQYILQPAEIKFKKEFKFYFLNFYQAPKDSTSVGTTR